ncbi:MAG: hypothetical protein AAF184_25430 [Pseudomonadota bacterium]
MLTRRFVAVSILLCTTAVTHADPADMPLLGDEDLHLYTIPAFEVFDLATRRAVDERYDELIAAGMDTARHLFDWRELEPSPGAYDRRLVVEAMGDLRARGIAHQFPNIVIIDSAGPEVPDHIEDLLRAGAAWDDPAIVAALENLLDVFVPLMLAQDAFALGLSNEPGGYYEDEPAQAASFKGLIAAAVTRVHALEPDLATTVVFAGPEDAAIDDLMPLLDVASFNTYVYALRPAANCVLEDIPLELFRADRASNVGTYLDALVDAAQGKLINIQEIGQATEGRSLGPLAGESSQAAVYDALATALDARRAHFRTVCNWTLNDHDSAWNSLARALIASGLPRCYAGNIRDIFTKTGLVRSDADATPKPAFEVFKRSVGELRRQPD